MYAVVDWTLLNIQYIHSVNTRDTRFRYLYFSDETIETLIATFGQAIIKVEIFDAFGGRSTMAQEVSKSTEVRYTTLQLRAATGQEPRPRGRISSANSTNDRS